MHQKEREALHMPLWHPTHIWGGPCGRHRHVFADILDCYKNDNRSCGITFLPHTRPLALDLPNEFASAFSQLWLAMALSDHKLRMPSGVRGGNRWHGLAE